MRCLSSRSCHFWLLLTDFVFGSRKLPGKVSDLTVMGASYQTRYHSKPLLLILRAHLLPIPTLLLLRPQSHLASRHSGKQHSGPTPRNHTHGKPSHDLEQIIGTRHPTKAKPRRDASLCAASRSQVSEDDVRVQVCQFAENVSCEGGVVDERVERCGGSGVGGRVDEVSNQHSRQDPVVRAIFDDVGSRHRSSAEAVDEEGLQLPLQEVKADQPQRPSL